MQGVPWSTYTYIIRRCLNTRQFAKGQAVLSALVPVVPYTTQINADSEPKHGSYDQMQHSHIRNLIIFADAARPDSLLIEGERFACTPKTTATQEGREIDYTFPSQQGVDRQEGLLPHPSCLPGPALRREGRPGVTPVTGARPREGRKSRHRAPPVAPRPHSALLPPAPPPRGPPPPRIPRLRPTSPRLRAQPATMVRARRDACFRARPGCQPRPPGPA